MPTRRNAIKTLAVGAVGVVPAAASANGVDSRNAHAARIFSESIDSMSYSRGRLNMRVLAAIYKAEADVSYEDRGRILSAVCDALGEHDKAEEGRRKPVKPCQECHEHEAISWSAPICRLCSNTFVPRYDGEMVRLGDSYGV